MPDVKSVETMTACLEPPKPRENDHRAAHHTSDPSARHALKLAGVPMGRLAETITKPASGRQYSCKIETLCADDADRKAVAALMSDPDLSVRSIARTLGVSEGTAFKHRSKACQCFKAAA